MKSQVLVVFENATEFRPISFQEQVSAMRQLLTLFQREIHAMDQDCKKFERQYREFVDCHQSLLRSVAA